MSIKWSKELFKRSPSKEKFIMAGTGEVNSIVQKIGGKKPFVGKLQMVHQSTDEGPKSDRLQLKMSELQKIGISILLDSSRFRDSRRHIPCKLPDLRQSSKTRSNFEIHGSTKFCKTITSNEQPAENSLEKGSYRLWAKRGKLIIVPSALKTRKLITPIEPTTGSYEYNRDESILSGTSRTM